MLAGAADATDLTRAEEIRLRYAVSVESSDDAIIAKTLDGVISTWNAAAERLFGYTEKEAIGQPIIMIIPPELHDQERDVLRRLRAGERLEHYETVRITKAGKRIDVSLTISPLRDLAGRIVGCSKIARDITEPKKAEAALRESEERFRGAMNNIASGVYTLDLNGLVTYLNPAAENMLGWTNAELLGRNMHDMAHYKHPDGSPFPASHCPGLQVLQKGVELREQVDMFIRKDGSFLPVVYSASPLTAEGRTIGIVVGFRDDTPRREAERALRESEARFRLVANTAPVLLWMTGADKLCTFVNDGWLEFTGRSLEEELGSGWSQGVHPDDVEICLETYATAFDRREPFQMEYRVRRRDGEYRWVLDQGVPRFNADTSFAGYIGSCVDVTERKLTEEALSTVNQKLIGAHEEESARIARELHDDINQRLALVSVRLDSLTHSPPASAGEITQEIGAVNQQIADLAFDIQALSHRLHPSKVELLGLEAGAAGLCDELSHRHDVEIDVHFENVPTALPSDISLCLYRVLQEALQNAVKHSGSPRAHVSITGGVNNINLTVEDSGVGFDPHDAMRGNGLGLTSMKERLKLVGGQLSIHSKRGRGTMIQALVPLRLP